jgi:hypothetical protein
MPFDWRRITDAEKQAKVDSAKAIADSVANAGGYYVNACYNGSQASVSFVINPPPPPGPGVAGGTAGSGGRSGLSSTSASGADGGPLQCARLPVTREYSKPGDIPDYLPPIRRGSVVADADDNVWILPTTSFEAKDGLLYDVVNRKGELFERVQLPANRTIAGFGKGGVVYLAWRDGANGYVLERRTIQR